MSELFPGLVKDADGVYQPLPPAWLQVLLLGGGLAALLTLYAKGGSWISLGIVGGLAIGKGVRSALEWRRHGRRGQPLVRVADGTLTLRRADTSGKDFKHPLAQMAHLVVYGPAGRRFYRVIRTDGSWREARPQWQPKAEALVIEFLRDSLGARVIVEAPQNGFEQARGDGPYFGS